jgi:hypothetical protein
MIALLPCYIADQGNFQTSSASTVNTCQAQVCSWDPAVLQVVAWAATFLRALASAKRAYLEACIH